MNELLDSILKEKIEFNLNSVKWFGDLVLFLRAVVGAAWFGDGSSIISDNKYIMFMIVCSFSRMPKPF